MQISSPTKTATRNASLPKPTALDRRTTEEIDASYKKNLARFEAVKATFETNCEKFLLAVEE